MNKNEKWGGIVGDVLGSVYENPSDPFKTDDPSSIDLTRDDVFFTDDTVLSVATMDVVMYGNWAWDSGLSIWGRRYPRCGFSSRFKAWLAADYTERDRFSNSNGNGAAMRVWPIALLDLTLPELYSAVEQNAGYTHDDVEAMYWTKAQAALVKYANSFYVKSDAEAIELFKKNLSIVTGDKKVPPFRWPSNSLDELRPSVAFSTLASDTVPLAYLCVLESTSFESAIQNAISMGSDADTVASMAGAVAGTLYGVPQHLVDFVRKKLTLEMIEVIDSFDPAAEKKYRDSFEKDDSVTMYSHDLTEP